MVRFIPTMPRTGIWNPLVQLDHPFEFDLLLSTSFLPLECDLMLWVLQAFELELRREYTEHYLCKQVLLIFV